MRRPYSAREIETMRYVIASSTPSAGSSHHERIMEIEEKLRTYVIAGADPLDLAEHINTTYFGNMPEKTNLHESAEHRVAMM